MPLFDVLYKGFHLDWADSLSMAWPQHKSTKKFKVFSLDPKPSLARASLNTLEGVGRWCGLCLGPMPWFEA